MAVTPAPSSAPAPPSHDTASGNGAQHQSAAASALELLGRPVQPATAPGTPLLTDAETMHALRLLALDNLVDLVNLREALAERQAEVSELREAADTWRQRAFSESAAREALAAEAYARQRELVTVLHRQLIENEALHAELAWRRRPWWQRAFRRIRPERASASAAR